MESAYAPFIIHDDKIRKRITWTKDESCEIGSGGFGTVYKCKLDGAVAAVKRVLFIDSLGSKCTRHEVKKVVDMWRTLEHKNIIPFIDHAMDEKAAYLFMEFAINGSVHKYLNQSKNIGLKLEIFFRWSKEICDGLEYLHNRSDPIIHRDLTTSNALMDHNLTLMLSDFDFIREINISSSSLLSCTGAPIYTAPELIKKTRNESIDCRSDIFSLGFLLWEMMTCTSPVEVKKCDQQLKAMLFVLDTQNGIRPFFPSYCPEYLRNIINICWRPNVRIRPSSAAVLKMRIEECEKYLYAEPGITADSRMFEINSKNQDNYSECLDEEIKMYSSKGDKYAVRIGGKDGQGSGDGEFKMPYGMTSTESGNIYICDGENRRVQIFSFEGEFRGKFGKRGKERGEFQWPRDIAITRSGDLAIVDSWNHRIHIHSPDGVLKHTFGKQGKECGELSYPWSIACDGNGRLFVTEVTNSRVQVFSENGEFINEFGKKTGDYNEIVSPLFITVAKDGRLIITDRNQAILQLFTADGEWEKRIDGGYECDLKGPHGICVDSRGNLLVVDEDIKVFKSTSYEFEYMTQFGGNYLKIPIGIEVLPNDQIAVSDTKTHTVTIF